jgi:putative ABC transport system permease protein
VQDTVGGDYFQTVGIPLRRGRFFNQFDDRSQQRVVIINDALVRRDFADVDPIGETITIENNPFLIVGVVGDTRQFTINQPATPEIFTPLAQTATTYAYVLVRGNKLDDTLTRSVRNVFASVDPDLPLPQRTLQSALDDALGTPRFQAKLLAGFASIALILALIGVYGVVSYEVAQRRPEVAIRLALGATRANIQRLILSRGIFAIGGGLSVGIALAVCVSLVLRQQLFGLNPFDARAYIAIAASVSVTGALACLLPASRASQVDPLSMLRAE